MSVSSVSAGGGSGKKVVPRRPLPPRESYPPTRSTRESRGPSVPCTTPEVKYFYPQSLWTDAVCGGSDNDVVTARNTYSLPLHQRLSVGKYVADPNNEDISNPKYQPRHSISGASSESRSYGSPYGDGMSTSTMMDEEIEPVVRRKTLKMSKAIYPVIAPQFASSSASLFFPVFYGTATSKEKEDPRGTPEEINNEIHPDDREYLPTDTVTTQKGNLNRMCLYKIGPGAVAFKVVINAFEAAKMQYTPSNEHFNILWAKRATPYTLASLSPYQKVNHFPGTWGVGRKDSLAHNIHKMKRHFGEDTFDIVPASFLIPQQLRELQLDATRNPDAPGNPLIYIVKPRASSCGRGIQLFKGIPPFSSNMKPVVCQRYIGNPFLIYGRKFDLRIYCVITSFDPLRIYLFDEGLVRFAAEKYPGADQDLDNIHKHLTNYSVNKTAELNKASRGKDYDCDDPMDIKWCISDFKKYLVDHHPEGLKAWDTIEKGCDDVVVKTFLSIENEVISRVRAECKDKTGRNCFELFGLDLMADSDLKVRLIEVNIMPSLATGSNLDKAVKGRMLAHMLTMIRCIPNRRDGVSADGSDFVPQGAVPGKQEKVYLFGKHPHPSARAVQRPLVERFNDPTVPDSMLSATEVLMLVEAAEELRCAGGFRRIYPIAETVQNFLPLFSHGVRRNNYLLASAAMIEK